MLKQTNQHLTFNNILVLPISKFCFVKTNTIKIIINSYRIMTIFRITINNKYYNHITTERCGKSPHLVLQNIIQCKYNINYCLIHTLNRVFIVYVFSFVSVRIIVFIPATIKIDMLYCKSPPRGAHVHTRTFVR